MLSKALLYTWYFGMLARLRAASIENFCNPVTSPLSPNRFRYPARVTVLPASCWWYGMHFFYTSLPLLLTEYNYSKHWVILFLSRAKLSNLFDIQQFVGIVFLVSEIEIEEGELKIEILPVWKWLISLSTTSFKVARLESRRLWRTATRHKSLRILIF